MIKKLLILTIFLAIIFAIVIPKSALVNILHLGSSDGDIESDVVTIAVFLRYFMILFLVCFFLAMLFGKKLLPLVKSAFVFLEKVPDKKFLIAVIIVSTAIRLVLIFAIDTPPFSDAEWFHQAALSIAQGNGYSIDGEITAYRPVGYPGVIGVLYYLFGTKVLIAQLFNLLCSILIIIYSFLLFRQETSSTVAKLGLIVWAFFPAFIANNLLVMSEILLLASMIISIYYRKPQNLVQSSVFAISAVLAIFVRPVVMPLYLIYITYYLFKERKASLAIAFGIVFISCTGLWSLRNYRVFSGFVPFSTNSGVNLYIGNNPKATGAYYYDGDMIYEAENEYARSQIYKSKALRFIKENPLRAIALLPRKLFYLFAKDTIAVQWSFMNANPMLLVIATLLSQIYYLLVLLLFICYIFRKLFKKEVFSEKAFYIFIYFVLIYLAYFGEDRFHFPLLPIISLYGSSFIFSLVDKHILSASR